jgi:hypothetical protein
LALDICEVDAVDDLFLNPLLQMGFCALQLGNAIDDVDRKVEAVDLIATAANYTTCERFAAL